MKTSLYSVYDTVAQVFNKPFTELNDSTAIRVFSQGVESDRNKDDYVLYKLATFTDHDGIIDPITPIRIIQGLEVKRAEQPEMEMRP